MKIEKTVTLVIAILLTFTTISPAQAITSSSSVVVIGPQVGGQGNWADAFTTQSEVRQNAAWLTAANLATVDTVVLMVVKTTGSGALTSTQESDLVSFVYNGGKLIIWDSELTSSNYAWLPYSFSTNNPGAYGATGSLTDVEDNTLSHSSSLSPFYIDASLIGSGTDAVGDANVFTSYSSNWCVDMTAINVLGTNGPVHTYAPYGTGLFIYNGLDADVLGSSSNPAPGSGTYYLAKLQRQELNTPWGTDYALPCGVVINPSNLDVTKTADKASYTIGETVTFTIATTNTGTNTINNVVLTDTFPPELSTLNPLTYNLGNINAGQTITTTITATANIAGTTVQNVAGATGTDSGTGQTVGDTGSVTIAVTTSSCTGSTCVPEFPTVALPIMSVLGIMFLMSRKKHN